jgi:predicted transcriptional regulator
VILAGLCMMMTMMMMMYHRLRFGLLVLEYEFFAAPSISRSLSGDQILARMIDHEKYPSAIV